MLKCPFQKDCFPYLCFLIFIVSNEKRDWSTGVSPHNLFVEDINKLVNIMDQECSTSCTCDKTLCLFTLQADIRVYLQTKQMISTSRTKYTSFLSKLYILFPIEMVHTYIITIQWSKEFTLNGSSLISCC